MEILKLLSANELVAQIINFMILFFILRAFLWKRVLKLLDERKARIAAGFKKIEDAQKGIEELRADYERKLSSIELIAKQKLQEAVSEGRKQAEQIIKESHLNGEKIIECARADIKYEITKAKEKMKEEIIDLTISATESLIEEKLTEEDDKKIVNDFLNRLDNLQ